MQYLQAGQRLRQYHVIKVLGVGGFSVVYLAKDEKLQKLVAIKEYFPEEFAQRRKSKITARAESVDDFFWGKDRFLAEAQTLAMFQHPGIIGVIQIFEENNTAYMVLEYARGRSLRQWLDEIDGVPTQEELDLIVEPILDALELIHRNNKIHRDIAPDNIYIRDDGSPVLLDFGSTRDAIARHTRMVSAIVKSGYSPYEQYSTSGSSQGAWSDIYAFGATLYHAISGAPPEEAIERILTDNYVSAREMAKGQYRPAFLEAVDWSLKLAPKDRPQSIQAWRAQLSELSSEHSSVIAPPPPAEPIVAELIAPNSSAAPSISHPSPPQATHANFSFTIVALSLCSALLSFYSPWQLLQIGGVGPLTKVSLLPGVYFAVVVCTALYLNQRFTPVSLLAAFLVTITAWVAAYEAAFVIAQKLYAARALGPDEHIGLLAAGLAGGFTGSTMTALAVSLTSREFRTRRAWITTIAVGTIAGLLLDEGTQFGLLFIVWQPAVAASIASGLSRSSRERAASPAEPLGQRLGYARSLTYRHAAMFGLVAVALAAHALYSLQLARESVLFLAAAGVPEKLQSYLETCILCQNRVEALKEIDLAKEIKHAEGIRADERSYQQGRGDAAALRRYVNTCKICSYKAQALEEIDSIEEERQYATAHGNIDLLNAYMANCHICRYRSNAIGEVQNLNREAELQAHTATFIVTNTTSGPVNLTFYDQLNKRRVDPPEGRIYVHAGNSTSSYHVSCSSGQSVCYSALIGMEPLSPFWGVGYEGKQPCNACCLACGSSLQLSLNAADTRTPPPTITWIINNNTNQNLSIAFYSQQRVWGWPDWNHNWSITNRTTTFTIECRAGEPICYGAWPLGNTSGTHWGAGPYRQYYCADCCRTCNGGTYTFNLTP